MTEREAIDLGQRRWQWLGRIVSAHIAMLAEVELIDREARDGLLLAVERVAGSSAPAASLPELISLFDERVDAQTPSGLSGAGRVGRGTSELIATIVRTELREELLVTATSLLEVRATLVDLALQHLVTLMPAYLDGQIAQPTTFGHALGTLLGPLARATEWFERAIAVTNQSPMGAVALASTGMPIDRERVAALLGFESAIANTFDAVTATDQLAAATDAVAAMATAIRRFLGELLAWTRSEPASFRLPDAAAATTSDLPQLRAPAGFYQLHARAAGVEHAAAVAKSLIAAMPFGPWFSGIHDAVGAVLASVRQGAALANVTQTMFEQLEVNRALLANRAGKGFGTSSDLADFLMIEEQIDPGSARNIAALAISRTREQGLEAAGINSDLIDGAALLVIGREIKPEFEAISRYLAPRRFIERRTATGAPSPSATRAYLELEQASLEQARTRLQISRQSIQNAEDSLNRLLTEAAASLETR